MTEREERERKEERDNSSMKLECIAQGMHSSRGETPWEFHCRALKGRVAIMLLVWLRSTEYIVRSLQHARMQK